MLTRESRQVVKAASMMIFVVVWVFIGVGHHPDALANPFEPLPTHHWSYEAVGNLSEKGVLRRYIHDRLQSGYRLTHVDLSIWLGEALDRLQQLAADEWGERARTPWTMDDLIDVFNRVHPDDALSEEEAELFVQLVAYVREHLGFFGYTIPADIEEPTTFQTRSPRLAEAMDQFRLRNQGFTLEQESYTLRLSETWEATHIDDLDVNPSDTIRSRVYDRRFHPQRSVAANVLPQVTISGEIEEEESPHHGVTMKVGAVLYPFPDLTLGALLYGPETGYRFFSGREEETQRLDLSAEIGQWILSLRRRQVVRLDEEDEETYIYTRVGLEYPLGDRAIIRAGRELREGSDVREEERGTLSGEDHAMTTELDLEVILDRGKFGLGFVLESIGDRGDAGPHRPFRTTASVEHAISPIGTATAGISIGPLLQETSSNVGLRYDFDDATVSLQYQQFNIGDEDALGVTTAEVSIKF